MRRFMIVLSLAVLAATAACSTGPTISMDGPSSMPAIGVSPSTAPTTARPTAAVRPLDPAEFEAAIAGERVTINVHVPDQGSLPGTDLAVPFDQITARAVELPHERSTPLAIYCLTGHMSTIAGPELTAEVRRVAEVPVAAVLVRSELPVDVRHNSKIDRAELSRWATERLS